MDLDFDDKITSIMASITASTTLIEERIRKMEEEVFHLDEELARKREELRLLELERENRAQNRDNLNRLLVTPLRRLGLPPELVSEIVIQAQTTYDTGFHLGQVCQEWCAQAGVFLQDSRIYIACKYMLRAVGF